MSGDPPHHPHNRPWDFIGIPNWRQPQHAHMAHKHSIIRQPNWHPPTTESMKVLNQLPHNFALHQMFENIALPPVVQPPPPVVDLSVNGDAAPAAPISLSVKDAKKPDDSPQPKCLVTKKNDCDSPDFAKVTAKRASPLDSVLERLKPSYVNASNKDEENKEKSTNSQDESNDSGCLNVAKEEEYNTEDSLDSNKSRRKRKPNKTVRCSNKNDVNTEQNEKSEIKTCEDAKKEEETDKPRAERRRSSSLDINSVIPAKTRRKTSSESETIDNIAAMVQEGLKEKEHEKIEPKNEICQESTVSESTTKTQLITPAQKKETHFVEIENKLEEMFAGIEDADPLKSDEVENVKTEEVLDEVVASTSQDNVSSTSNDANLSKNNVKVKKSTVKSGVKSEKKTLVKKAKKNVGIKKKITKKLEIVKDVYDSSSNGSCSKSRGPFLHVRGPRNSPVSVNVVNAPQANEEDFEKKIKSKKFHDDSEYRHKVRSKGLHCSTLSTKYDAQTKDATWICVFCKRGPHTTTSEKVPKFSSSYPSGDLFGPYFVTIDCEEFDKRLEDPFDRQFHSKKMARALDAKSTKKSKRKLSESEDLADLGIVETANKRYEVWAHEECLVWSPGVYLVGPKIVGLQEAVWTSSNVGCARCALKGANVCCLARGCVKVAHVWCAKSLNWNFDEEKFETFCTEHRKMAG